ncbi:hypothetical protein IQ06DRAFT_372453 [Phaeosphaeriaceae sp. SRC1lsM3a]|nr:hypothetical protein IQ06DRAFT_372453 [Stagonospora sp. SRC1lsM3a]
MAPPTVTDPTQLPGAILFLTVTMSGTPATIRTLIAYDPEIVPNKPLADSIARWKVDHFPYRERFTTGKVANFGPNDYYSGVFGINANKTDLSQPWPYLKDDASTGPSKIKNGIVISFWNSNDSSRGLFTNAAGKRFDEQSKTNVMTLTPGNKKELLGNGVALEGVQSIKLDFYAMKERGKIIL